MAQQGFDGFKQRLRLQHHALAAAKRPIIHGAVTIFRKLPEILNLDVNQPGLARPTDNSVLERSGKKLRKNGDQINAHLATSVDNPGNGSNSIATINTRVLIWP